MTRRQIAKAAAATALSYSRILGANGRIQMGFIGLGNRGDQVHDGFLEYADSQTVAICDLRDDYLNFAAAKSRGTPARYKDYKKLLENKDVDGVAQVGLRGDRERGLSKTDGGAGDAGTGAARGF